MVYQEDENADDLYIRWDDVLIIKKQSSENSEEQNNTESDGSEESSIKANDAEDLNNEADVVSEDEPLARSVVLASSLDGVKYIEEGTEIVITATLEGFRDDDQYTVYWSYSSDGGKTYQIIEDAHDLEYRYLITIDNAHNIWQIVISLE